MKIEPTAYFLRQFKRLCKKYPSMVADMRTFSDDLALNPEQGTSIRRGAHKIRLAITSKGKGKSSGARVITFIRVDKETIYLLDIYDKSERTNIADEDLDNFINEIENIV
jgi:mRNA-degrading endonuclease RelE of RelBE toxin-antitoxin system